MKKSLTVLIAIGLLAGCSSMSVETDYWEEADFSGIQTFQYRESDKTVEAAAPLAHQRIVSAINSQMRASGLTAAEDDPDVFVTYYGSTSERLQFITTYTGMSGWHMARGGRMGVASTRTVSHSEGTLVIDIWDAGKDQLLWRSTVTDTLSDNPDRNTDRIARAVERALRDFPPN